MSDKTNDEAAGHIAALRNLCREVDVDLERIIQEPGARYDTDALDIACKLFDAIMDPEEAKP